MFVKRLTTFIHLLFAFGLCCDSHAQPVSITDPQLRVAIYEALNIDAGITLDHTDLTRLTRLNAHDRGVTSLSGLELAPYLEHLSIWGNPISDLAPIASLRKLKGLDAGNCRIGNLGPLSNLPHLEWVYLAGNQIVDVEPLATLPELKFINLNHNQIINVAPLAACPRLSTLHILNNPAIDYTSLLARVFDELIYDAICDMPPLSLAERIDGRSYPSVFAAWGGIVNREDLTWQDNITHHDMWFRPADIMRYSRQRNAMVGRIDHAQREREEHLSRNPYFIRLFEIDWESDAIQTAIAVSKCGYYDGVFFDHWDDIPGEPDSWFEPRLNIVREIRDNTREDFLILGNVNRHRAPRSAHYLNGGFMESLSPSVDEMQGGRAQLEDGLAEVEDTLSWLEANLREPRINALEGWGFPDEPPDSQLNRQWMRVFTTISLTHSDGYVLFVDGRGGHHHYWYDFWDADLGQPVGDKGQLYQDIDGLYIREFTNGWAVYNHSGERQVITLPELTTGVASGLEDTEHTLSNLDGEMYLRVTPANPADVNEDGVVNILDLILVAQEIGAERSEPDVNGDGVINVFDLVMVAGAIGGDGAAPSAYSPELSLISAADVESWLAQAQGLGVGDANLQRGIRFLEGLLAALTPKETTLLPNYPNPFNPETWIPYHLGQEAEVAITIYDTKGTLVRQLALGNQAVGYYAERGKAAYWDGRNEDGEAVASGIYIYQFRAGDYAASRRLVIVK